MEPVYRSKDATSGNRSPSQGNSFQAALEMSPTDKKIAMEGDPGQAANLLDAKIRSAEK